MPEKLPAVEEDDVATEATAEEGDGEEAARMDLTVVVDKAGPCKRHVRVTVPRSEIDAVISKSVNGMMDAATVPGFRVGHVPEALIRKRFRKELADEVKQKVLMQSLEQISEDEDLEPINVPNLDPEAFEIPDEGDFEYEFDVEVRPEFELPKYKGLKIDRPVREISDADVSAYVDLVRADYGQLEPIDEPVSAGDYVTVDVSFAHNGQPLRTLDEVSVRVRPTLRLQDGELAGFEKLMKGAVAGDVCEADIKVSLEADNVEMRGETVQAAFTVLDVKRLRLPEMNQEFFDRINVSDEEEFRTRVRDMLERQVVYQQRQATRKQVLERITESADWDLPEDLVRKQVDNALRREILEMRQAGFTPREIKVRENELRQNALSMTRKNLKEHFVLDRVIEEEKIEVTAGDIDEEITLMAMQSGENPRRVRARLQKSGVIENLEAQIKERKAVDVILENAEFKDSPLPLSWQTDVEAIDRSICNPISDTTVEDEGEDDAAE
ncbi:MAG: trigger factor [Planctomycetaceae bacterium]|nr:trigger factor [Planctomycetaceae bacterium]